MMYQTQHIFPLVLQTRWIQIVYRINGLMVGINPHTKSNIETTQSAHAKYSQIGIIWH
ncbi:hypothetical protein D3C72_849010 [compost metagenome]